jgi:MerR family transcriptional regulator, light-induced transcriptional regulator
MESKKRLYPIRYVVRQTGLTSHLIRSWERRYGAVVPKRTETNRRLYSDEDISRLNLLSHAVKAGNSIAQIASLDSMALQKLSSAQSGSSQDDERQSRPAYDTALPVNHFRECLVAIERFDPAALENALNRAAVELNRITLLVEVVAPFIQKIGELWSEGTIKIYQEHAATSVLRTFLGDLLRFTDTQQAAPNLIVTTPAGQHHELGALIVAVAAADEGWRVTYLGPNLPAEEIAGAAGRFKAKVVCLSLVFPADDPKSIFEVKKLRHYLPKTTRLIIGGKAAGMYHAHLKQHDAEIIQNIPDLIKSLRFAREEQSPATDEPHAP